MMKNWPVNLNRIKFSNFMKSQFSFYNPDCSNTISRKVWIFWMNIVKFFHFHLEAWGKVPISLSQNQLNLTICLADFQATLSWHQLKNTENWEYFSKLIPISLSQNQLRSVNLTIFLADFQTTILSWHQLKNTENWEYFSKLIPMSLSQNQLRSVNLTIFRRLVS